jgi:hypothetical protein
MTVYILSGKVVCGDCGSLCAGLTYTNRAGKGRRYFYYRCQKKCGNRQIPKADLEQAVIDRIADQVFSDEATQRIVKRVQEMYAEWRKTSGSQREVIEQEIRDLERKIDNWLEALGEGIGNRQALIEKVNAATDKKEYLERELLKIQAMEHVPQISEQEIMKVMNKKVTINDVRNAVNAALDTAFPGIPILDEEIKQGLTPPCFFVRLLEPEHTQELGRRFFRYHPFVVRYFAQDRSNAVMYDMAEKLTTALQQIEVAGRPVRGTGMRFEIIDEVLHFFVEYNFHVWAPRLDDPKMRTLDVQEGLK